jgi:hypothetical protein
MSPASSTHRSTARFGFVSPFVSRLICVAACAAGSFGPSSAGAAPLSPFQKGPYLQDLGPSSVTIRAELSTSAPAVVELREARDPRAASDAGADAGADASSRASNTSPGKGSAKPIVVRDGLASAFHSIKVDGLTPRTHYTYEIQAAGASQKGELVTAPTLDSKEPFSFLIYGDNRSDEVSHAAVMRAISRTPTDFLVHTGDFVEDGSNAADWQTFFDVEAALLRERCVFACVGNHELIGGGAASYLRYFGPTWDASGPGTQPMLHGSFRWANTRFFLLNAMDAWDSSGERAWLEGELARADREEGLTWRVVVLHHSPWSAGPHGGNPRILRAGIPASFAKHKIDLVVGGHDHIYERGFAEGVRYLISGGGGAPLYPIERPLSSTRKSESAYHFVEASVTTDRFTLAARRVDGTLLEQCAFDKSSPDWGCDPKPTLVQPASPPIAVEPTPKSNATRCGCRVVGQSSPSGLLTLAPLALGALAIVLRRRARR